MAGQLPGGLPPADAGRRTVPAASSWPGRRLIVVMLLVAAVLDLTRCGVVVAMARPAGPAIELVAVGLAAAALSLWTAHACKAGRRWAAWAALLIGAASAPQAALSGFRIPYAIPGTVTAALRVLLAVTVLATAGQTGPPGRFPGDTCSAGGQSPCDARRTPPPAFR